MTDRVDLLYIERHTPRTTEEEIPMTDHTADADAMLNAPAGTYTDEEIVRALVAEGADEGDAWAVIDARRNPDAPTLTGPVTERDEAVARVELRSAPGLAEGGFPTEDVVDYCYDVAQQRCHECDLPFRPSEITDRTEIAAKWNDVDGSHEGRCFVHPECAPTASLKATAIMGELLTVTGQPIVLEHTGGGVMTIYVGERNAEDRYAAVIGPGSIDGLGATFHTSDLYVGPDDDGETTPVAVTSMAELLDAVTEILDEPGRMGASTGRDYFGKPDPDGGDPDESQPNECLDCGAPVFYVEDAIESGYYHATTVHGACWSMENGSIAGDVPDQRHPAYAAWIAKHKAEAAEQRYAETGLTGDAQRVVDARVEAHVASLEEAEAESAAAAMKVGETYSVDEIRDAFPGATFVGWPEAEAADCFDVARGVCHECDEDLPVEDRVPFEAKWNDASGQQSGRCYVHAECDPFVADEFSPNELPAALTADRRLERVLEAAADAFFDVVAKEYTESVAGDVAPEALHQWEQANEAIVRHWLWANATGEAVSK